MQLQLTPPRQAVPHLLPWLSAVMDTPPAALMTEKLAEAENYLLTNGGEVIGWLGLAHCLDGVWSLDVAVKPEWQGKWLTRGVIRVARDILFGDGRRKFVMVHSVHPKAAKLALSMGAKPLYDAGMTPGVYLLSRDNYFNGRV